MQPGTPAQIFQMAAMGGTVERPLLAPLASAIAGELQGLPPKEFLRDTTKLSNAIRDLVRTLNVDVAVAEFGTLWDAEAMGISLDWSGGFPPTPRGRLPAAPSADFSGSGRGPVVLETVRRLSALLGDRVVVSAGVTGPARFARLSDGDISPAKAAETILAAVRLLCEAGAKLIWVVEDGAPPEEPGPLAAAMTPVWQSIAFYQGVGALHVAGSADGWEPFIAAGGPYLTCFDPERSPGLAKRFRSAGSFGLALPPGASGGAAGELVSTGRCFVLTNDDELSGRIAVRDLRNVVSALRSATRSG